MYVRRVQILVLLFLLMSISAFAQDATSTPTPAADADVGERVEVTGSHIKRIDTEGIAPVETVTRKDIDKKGYDNLSDVMKDLGVVNGNANSGDVITGNSTTPGNASISLRGLGSDNTLILLNGNRLPQDAITGTVDINLIPMAAVERIEILKDGASAIYGSDALAGVVNIITRKDFKGTQLGITQSVPTSYPDGKETSITAVNGINGESYNIVTSLGYRYDQAVNSRNRPWSNDNFSNTGSPANYANIDPSTGTGPTIASPNCPAGLLDDTGTHCRFKYSDYSQETPLINQIGGISEGHFELSSDVKVTARVNYVHRNAETIAAPGPNNPGQIIIPAADVPQFGLPGAIPGDNISVYDRLVGLGPRVTDVGTNSYGALVDTTIQLPKDWTLDVTSNYNLVKTSLVGTSGYALASQVNALINSGAYNPFAATGSQGNISSTAYVPTENTMTNLASLEVKASGDLTELPAGPLGMATGALITYSSYSDNSDSQTLSGNVIGNAGSSGAGHRTAEAAYSEFSVPLVRKKLEFQLAGRYDHYSDFGNTINPKAGFLFHAADDLLLRASVGTGFRAPLLSELYAGQSIGYQTFIDAKFCSTHPGSDQCQDAQYLVTSGGNPNLKQETSVSYTAGAIYEPVKAFNIGADWFYTDIKNVPGIDYDDMERAEAAGVNLANYGVVVSRDSSGKILSVTAPLQNLSEEQEMGVDITTSYTLGKFKLASEQNQLFFYRAAGFPGVPLTNKLGWYGIPKWRNTSSLTYSPNDRNSVSLTSRTIPGQLTDDQSSMISSLTTFDFSYTYNASKTWGVLTLSLVNILNTLPPTDSSNPTAPVNYGLYDPNGRTVVVGYKKDI